MHSPMFTLEVFPPKRNAPVDTIYDTLDGQFERTLFTSGYSSKTNTYYMNTYDDPAIRSYAMADYDMDSSELISVAR